MGTFTIWDLWPIAFATSAALAFMGYGFIYLLEHKVKHIRECLYPKTRLHVKTVYVFTVFNFLYLSLTCTLMFFNLI